MPRVLSFNTLIALCGLVFASGCTTLASTQLETPTPQPQKVVLENLKGSVSTKRSASIIKTLENPALDSDILQKHLAHEEAINRNSPLVLGNKITLLEDGPATYKAMFKAMREAKDHINLETFIFEDGEVGQQFAALLLERQRNGVQVNVIYDSVGCLNTPKEFFDGLTAGGIQVLEFNPINPALSLKKGWQINNRDHRKLLIVDGRIAFIGGVNISETYSSGSSSETRKVGDKVEAGWRDTHIQIDGPVVAEFQKLYLATWEKQKGEALTGKNFFPKLDPKGNAIVRAIGSTSDLPESPIYATLLSAINNAEQSVHITNAYFVPNPDFLNSLKSASKRGVNVELILPGQTDSWAVFHAGRSHYEDLLDAGVQIYERKNTILHSKTASIDGVWSTIGSTNLDWRSFLHNDEINAVILGKEFAQQLNHLFQQDIKASKKVTPDEWKKRSLLLRFQEWAARTFEFWL